jgi:hypothetical protein
MIITVAVIIVAHLNKLEGNAAVSNRIGMDLIKKLLKSTEPRVSIVQQDDKTRWPGLDNTLKLAESVDQQMDYVMFGNQRFAIKYYSSALLVKPSTGGFIPMGWFSYQQLKDAQKSAKVDV